MPAAEKTNRKDRSNTAQSPHLCVGSSQLARARMHNVAALLLRLETTRLRSTLRDAPARLTVSLL